MVDNLSNNNLLFSSIEILFGAIAIGIAMRYHLKEWKVAAIIGLIGISFSVGNAILLRTSFSVLGLVKQMMPFLAVAAWMLGASYFRHRVSQMLSNQESAIATIGSRIDAIEKEAARQ